VPSWEERISRNTNPAIRIEHQARYRMAVPAIRDAPVWCDLGCGNGIAAAAALSEPFAGRAVLVDVAEDVLLQAEREIQAARTVTLRADLTGENDLRRVRDALLEEDAGGGCITCFEVVEHLSSFVPLVETLVELAEHHGFTVALSVPNDAFWSIENPFHHTMFGEGAFEELRRLLPENHVVARQFALQGSLTMVDGDDGGRHTIELEPPAGLTPTHFLLGVGPGATRLAGAAAVGVADLVEQRRWERQRESDLAFLESLEGQMSEWRAYIHELEGRLGLPLSGTGGDSA
jgi:2-polyprenyl-3-methyl-5-hydroxy-6-metoxy-1,4-benzoquinol methylase